MWVIDSFHIYFVPLALLSVLPAVLVRFRYHWQGMAEAGHRQGAEQGRGGDFLDEPTSALDPLAEYDILTKFLELTEGKTSLIISHRIGLGRFADRVIVMKEGKEAQSGTHDELLAMGGEYSRMWHEQAKWYE